MTTSVIPGHREPPRPAAPSDLGAISSAAIQCIALIAIAILLILVILPATLAAAGVPVLPTG